MAITCVAQIARNPSRGMSRLRKRATIAPFEKGGSEARQRIAGDLRLLLIFDSQDQKQIPRPALCAGLPPFSKGGETVDPEIGSGSSPVGLSQTWLSIFDPRLAAQAIPAISQHDYQHIRYTEVSNSIACNLAGEPPWATSIPSSPSSSCASSRRN